MASPNARDGAPTRQEPLSKESVSPVARRNTEPGILRYSQPFAPRYVTTCPAAPTPPHTDQVTTLTRPSAIDAAKARTCRRTSNVGSNTTGHSFVNAPITKAK